MVSKRIKRAFVPQQESSDCGPSCLLSLIRFYGGDSSLLNLRKLCGTSLEGTSLLGLSHAAQMMGFDSQGVQVESLADLKGQPLPCVMVIKNDQGYDHFVLLNEIRDNTVLISDPAFGIKTMTIDELEKIWGHLCLMLVPNGDFKLKSDLRKEKKQWFISILKEDYPILASSIVLGVFIAFISLLMSLFSQLFIDKISPSHNKALLVQGILVLSFFLFAHVLITAARNKLLVQQRKDFGIRIIHSFFGRIINLPKVFFDTRSIGDMVARLNDTKRIQIVIETLLGETIISVFVAIVSLVFVFYYSWPIAVLCIICVPLFFFVVSIKNNVIILQQREMMAANAITESSFINIITGISDIQSYSKETLFLKKSISRFSVFQEKTYGLGKTKIAVSLLSGFGSTLVQILIVSIGAYFVFNNKITIGAFIAIIGISGSLFSSIANIALMRIPINEAKVAFDRLFELIMEHNHDGDNALKPTELPCLCQSKFAIELKDVSFRYPGKPLLLKQLNIHLYQGEITCIVGPSGSGKSTLCQMLGRLYYPASGGIEYNGLNINAIPIEEWRQRLAIVPQQPFLFPGTILDNICMGEKPNYEKLSSIFMRFNLNSLMASFSLNPDMVVEENGKNLSGGQQQVIALVRGLYKQSEIIVLDEITASMDYQNEAHIYHILNSIKTESLVVYITHKLDAAHMIGDRFVVLEDGIITAEGTHEQLMLTNNYYSRYWR